MKEFLHIFKYYAIRTYRRPIVWALYLGLPVGLTLINAVANLGLGPGNFAPVGIIVTLFILSFQFFSSELMYYDIFTTLRGNVADRLYMAPIKKKAFFAGALINNWIFSIFQAAAIFTVVYLVFPDNVYPSFWLLAVMVLMVSVLAQLKGILMPYIAKTRKSADGISAIICFGMMFLSGGLLVSFGDSPFAEFLMTRSNPLALAWSALQRDVQYQSGFIPDPSDFIITNIIILAVIIVATFALITILGRNRKTI
ncbi:MAG: ABC transporter permease [Defluviitaleaceae bacterium]|nr:ABC transporter permease [Defluviitaleaceae bacterium]